jgi:hypothetical protein
LEVFSLHDLWCSPANRLLKQISFCPRFFALAWISIASFEAILSRILVGATANMTDQNPHIPNYPPSWQPTIRSYPTTGRANRDYASFDSNETFITLSVGGDTFPCTKEMLVWENPKGFLAVLAANRGDPAQRLDFDDNSALDRRCPLRFSAILRYLNGIVDDVPYDRTPEGVAHLAAIWADADFYGFPRLKSIVMFHLTKLVWYLLCNASLSTAKLEVAGGETVACGSVCSLESTYALYYGGKAESMQYVNFFGFGVFSPNSQPQWVEEATKKMLLAASNVERVCQHYLQCAIISSAELH